MGILDFQPLGNVSDGWFAQIAHGIESAGRTLFGNGVYNNMEIAANQHVGAINQQAIHNALAGSATPHHAIQAGTTAIAPLVNPTVRQLPQLTITGVQTMTTAVRQTIVDVLPDLTSWLPRMPDLTGWLMPLLIGVGILGGGSLLVGALASPSTPRQPSRRSAAY